MILYMSMLTCTCVSSGWGESGSGRLGKVGGGEWDEDTCNTGTTITGWPVAGDGRARTLSTPGTPGSQWIPSNKDGWGKKVCIIVHYFRSCTHCMYMYSKRQKSNQMRCLVVRTVEILYASKYTGLQMLSLHENMSIHAHKYNYM